MQPLEEKNTEIDYDCIKGYLVNKKSLIDKQHVNLMVFGLERKCFQMVDTF